MTGLAAFLTDIGSIFTSVVGMFGDVLDQFTTNPVLAITFTVFLASAVIGLVTRLSHAR